MLDNLRKREYTITINLRICEKEAIGCKGKS